MKREAMNECVELLARAREGGRLQELPASCAPTSLEEAHAVQEALAAALGERIAGWKVMTTPEGHIVRGALVQSRVVTTGATLAAAEVPLLGVEPEIAFRFERAIAPRAEAYSYEEVAAAVTAFLAIEVVDSRFSTYPATPLFHRVADFMSNGAFVVGPSIADWRRRDLAHADVELFCNGHLLARKAGGHPTGDPLLPAVALVNDIRARGIDAGQIVTTGSYAGLHHGKPGKGVRAVFHGIGEVGVKFE
jgi:2-keto-4-pentenoate hydratase